MHYSIKKILRTKLRRHLQGSTKVSIKVYYIEFNTHAVVFLPLFLDVERSVFMQGTSYLSTFCLIFLFVAIRLTIKYVTLFGIYLLSV
jgi:hypothetical protein